MTKKFKLYTEDILEAERQLLTLTQGTGARSAMLVGRDGTLLAAQSPLVEDERSLVASRTAMFWADMAGLAGVLRDRAQVACLSLEKGQVRLSPVGDAALLALIFDAHAPQGPLPAPVEFCQAKLEELLDEARGRAQDGESTTEEIQSPWSGTPTPA
jgi:predicted regulator of Ras-like GTPase activity (Roadblock/LC7/MglB family)